MRQGTPRSKYQYRHRRLREAHGSAWQHRCIDCDVIADEWSHTHDTDPDNLQNYNPRCYACHHTYDHDMVQAKRRKNMAINKKDGQIKQIEYLPQEAERAIIDEYGNGFNITIKDLAKKYSAYPNEVSQLIKANL